MLVCGVFHMCSEPLHCPYMLHIVSFVSLVSAEKVLAYVIL
jgi:hypothetical protein